MTQAPICLPYDSGSGHTARLAQAISDGIDAPHRLIDVAMMTDEAWQALDAAPAILFGSPTYMGNTSARFAGFLEDAADRWPDQIWADKLAAGFTVATYPSGDKLMTLQRLVIYAAQQGMIWVGQTEIGAPVDATRPGINRDGSALGLMATAARDKQVLITPEDQATAALFGARIAAAVARWNGARSHDSAT